MPLCPICSRDRFIVRNLIRSRMHMSSACYLFLLAMVPNLLIPRLVKRFLLVLLPLLFLIMLLSLLVPGPKFVL